MTAAHADEVPIVITEPGVYDVPAEAYHADPVPGGSLSSTGARRLMECPAKFRHAAVHGQKPKKEFDLGHAAHKLVLGNGPHFTIVDAPDWRTKAAQTAKKAAYEAGEVPLLPQDLERVQAMAAQIRQHPIASALFNPATGKAEQSAFVRDPRTGVWMRCRYDWLRAPGTSPRLILVDYKTAAEASQDAISRAVWDHGYHQQAAWYSDIAVLLGLDPHPAFLFVFQEKEPPYVVTVAELTATALHYGRLQNRDAIDLYASCVESGVWPGYSNDIEYISLPPWAENQLALEYQS